MDRPDPTDYSGLRGEGSIPVPFPSASLRSRERMFGVLGIGFLLGMQHALEADHIAAVSSIAARRTDVRDIAKHGLTWGLGHTLTLFVFAGAAIPVRSRHPRTSRASAGEGGRHHPGWPRRSRFVAVVARPHAFSSAWTSRRG